MGWYHNVNMHLTLLRWFSVCKVSIASEKVMRKRAAEMIGDNLIVERVEALQRMGRK